LLISKLVFETRMHKTRPTHACLAASLTMRGSQRSCSKPPPPACTLTWHHLSPPQRPPETGYSILHGKGWSRRLFDGLASTCARCLLPGR
jgi:hypothetical protein